MHHDNLSSPQNDAGVSEDVLFDKLNSSILASLSHPRWEELRHKEETQVREARRHINEKHPVCVSQDGRRDLAI